MAARAGAAERALDMQAPAPAEAAMLQGPLAALRARLTSLLADWPGHPVLSQLDAIAARLLGALNYDKRDDVFRLPLMCNTFCTCQFISCFAHPCMHGT